jgi:hypothetical protein
MYIIMRKNSKFSPLSKEYNLLVRQQREQRVHHVVGALISVLHRLACSKGITNHEARMVVGNCKG